MRVPQRCVPLLVLGSVLACGASEPDSEESDLVSALVEGSAESRAVLTLVNDRTTTKELLTGEGTLSNRAASRVVGHRNGADGAVGTADDNPFDNAAELNDLRIGGTNIRKLIALAKKRGLLPDAAVDVVFSPQTGDATHLARIEKMLDEARVSIDVAMYSFSDTRTLEALARAKSRGVSVRFLYDDGGEHSRAGDPAATRSGALETRGIDVRFVNKIMHHKFAIIDGPVSDIGRASSARLISGSGNWSGSAATRFDENTLFLSGQPELALRFQREFNLLWEHSRDFVLQPFPHVTSPLSITDTLITDNPNVDALFTSQNFSVRGTTFSTTGENTVANAMVTAIQGAQRSIHVASGHLRSRPVAEALMARQTATPPVDIKVYLDGQEYIAASTHQKQEEDLAVCLREAGDNERRKRACTDKGFLFGYAVGESGINVRYKYYAYRWDHGYAPQMHHKYMVVDGETLFTGSYNLSDNAEHDTFENMIVFQGPAAAAIAARYEANFATIWETGSGRLAGLRSRIERDPNFPIVFDSMALTHAEVTDLKRLIRTQCPAVDSVPFRTEPGEHLQCER